jgi:DNA repair protein RecN (Recombination protein N)
MLKQLFIRNIAIIEALALDFDRGLTVITGESGSGKSILLDAIALAFGARVSPREVLRAGSERGQVELVFDMGHLQDHEAFRGFLAEQGVALPPDETEILLTREFTVGGSRSRINGIPVNREVLESLRPWVIDLHGQHELTSLFQKDKQRAYLDACGGNDLAVLKRAVAEAYEVWQRLKSRYDSLIRNRLELTQKRDFLSFQLTELQEAQLADPDEDSHARQELDVLNHGEKLIRVAAQGAALLSEGEPHAPPVLDQLSLLQKKLSEGAGHDPLLEALLQQVQGAHTELHAVAGELSRYAERVDLNPARMADLTDRLDRLEKLKRKYGPALRDVIARRDRLALELDTLENGEQSMEALETALNEQEKMLETLSQELSEARKALAEALKGDLLVELQVLSMPNVMFELAFVPTAYSREGVEEVEFLFSANPGEPLRPLAKVASGGELSRFLLAMKVLTAQTDGLLTLVFDEIDSGISGPTAKAVAEKLAGLSTRLQVLAITHQPMIAAMGRQHLHVEKKVARSKRGEETVQVDVHALEKDGDRRINVLSRLISGIETRDEAVEKFIRRLQAEADAFYQQSAVSAGLPAKAKAGTAKTGAKVG